MIPTDTTGETRMSHLTDATNRLAATLSEMDRLEN